MNLKKITLAVLLASSVVSCVKQVEKTDDVINSAQEVGGAIAEAWGDTDPLSMKKNDFIYQVTQQTIETDPEPYFTLQEGVTISDYSETSEHYVYKYLYQHATKQRGQDSAPQATREDSRKIKKAETASSFTAAPLTPEIKVMADDYRMVLGYERVLNLAYACSVDTEWVNYCKKEMNVDDCKLECANLSVEEYMRPVPEQVKLQENCGGYASCMWREKMVKFDWILTLKKGNETATQRLNYLVTLSPDLPFFARMTGYCSRGMASLPSGQRFLVSTCTKLENYRPAPTLPNP